MGITRATLITFANTLINNRGSTGTLGIAFDEVVEHMSQLDNPPIVSSTDLAITAGTARYSRPTACIKLLGIFDRGRQLRPISHHELNAYNITWRDDTGDPVAYYVEEDNADSVLLYPTPSTTSTGQWLHTQSSTDLPDHLAIYVLCSMIRRELAYPSDHQDKEMSAVWHKIEDIFAALAGLTEESKQ